MKSSPQTCTITPNFDFLISHIIGERALQDQTVVSFLAFSEQCRWFCSEDDTC